MKRILILLLAAATALPVLARADDEKTKKEEDTAKVTKSTVVVQEFAALKEGPPSGLVAKSAAVVIIPDLVKASFIAGAKHGEGVLVKHNADGSWGQPVYVNLSGGSVGFQAGVSSTDLVLLLMEDRNVGEILDGEFTLGGEAAVAAGPIGREGSAGTDAHADAPIYSYSRSKGVFAGISVDGSKLYLDKSENERAGITNAHETIAKAPAAGTPGAQLASALKSLTGTPAASSMGGR